MHEATITRDLVRKIQSIAREYEGAKVAAVKLRVGPLSGLSDSHLREHFEHDAQGTIAEGARVDITPGDELSGEILLESIEIVEE